MNITNEELESSFNFWLDHYIANGESHYDNTSEERIREIYFDKIVERVLQDLPEMSDEENDEIINRLADL